MPRVQCTGFKDNGIRCTVMLDAAETTGTGTDAENGAGTGGDNVRGDGEGRGTGNVEGDGPGNEQGDGAGNGDGDGEGNGSGNVWVVPARCGYHPYDPVGETMHWTSSSMWIFRDCETITCYAY